MDQTTASAPHQALQYDGRIGGLYRIFVVNLFLTIITLGIYRFWAITRWRRYLWSHMAFQEERFEYTGRGGELFRGILMAFGILFGFSLLAGLLSNALRQVQPGLDAMPGLFLALIFANLAGAARFSAQRYRLSRTLWCGIRGGMAGSALAYGGRSFRYALLVPLTLFQLWPWMQIRLAEHRINASRLGSAAFGFSGRARAVYPSYLAIWLGGALLFAAVTAVVWLIIAPAITPVLGRNLKDPHLADAVQRVMPVMIIGAIAFVVGAWLMGCWYTASFTRHLAGNTRLDTLEFSSIVTGRALLWLTVSNALIAVCTLGLGRPIVLHRSMRFLASNLLVSGNLDVAALHQTTLAAPRTGEGMFQLLDHGGVF
jgi:uncharacterized membrane protein YjgN (DUF898 family)